MGQALCVETPPVASLRRRFGAFAIDSLIWLPLGLLVVSWSDLAPEPWLVAVIALGVLGTSSEAVFLLMFGATPGKLLLGVRVMDASGGPIGWSHVWRRLVVGFIIGLGLYSAYAVAVGGVDARAFMEADYARRYLLLQQQSPDLIGWADGLGQGWFWLNVAAAVFDKRNRAVWDRIAATLVVDVRSCRTSAST